MIKKKKTAHPCSELSSHEGSVLSESVQGRPDHGKKCYLVIWVGKFLGTVTIQATLIHEEEYKEWRLRQF